MRGAHIAIRYDGQKGGDARSRYHAYRVATDRVPAFRWDAFSADADIEPDIPVDDPPTGEPDIPF